MCLTSTAGASIRSLDVQAKKAFSHSCLSTAGNNCFCRLSSQVQSKPDSCWIKKQSREAHFYHFHSIFASTLILTNLLISKQQHKFWAHSPLNIIINFLDTVGKFPPCGSHFFSSLCCHLDVHFSCVSALYHWEPCIVIVPMHIEVSTLKSTVGNRFNTKRSIYTNKNNVPEIS